MNNKLPIVIVAWNRAACLQRLLDSVLAAHYPVNDVPLIISIDKSDSPEVYALAENCEWKYGEKIIIKRTEHLGLKPHILQCADLVFEYGQVLILEDDLLVSPWFYSYALQALDFYKQDNRVAGVSLFNYQIAENEFFPFYPVADGSDNYFIQVASSWGQIFFEERWREFKDWLSVNEKEQLPPSLPRYLQLWSQHSWKKHLNRYLAESGKYFVFPRFSLSTNFGEPGVNTDRRGLFQSGLLEGEKQFRFFNLDESKAVYDAWFELSPGSLNKLCPQLAKYEYELDLHGTKNLAFVNCKFLLSSKKCSAPVLSFANDMQSAEENIIHHIEGDFYSLGLKENFEQNEETDIANYYIALNCIRDLAFRTYGREIHERENAKANERILEMNREFTAKMNAFVDDFYFGQKYPLFKILVLHGGNPQKLQATLDNIYNLQYPATRIEVAVFTKGKEETGEQSNDKSAEFINYENNSELAPLINEVVNKGEGLFFALLRSGELFDSHALERVNHLFSKYPDIQWLTGVGNQGGSMAPFRWSTGNFNLSLNKNAGDRVIAPASTFWKKHLWNVGWSSVNDASPDKIFNHLWSSFFTLADLYTCQAAISGSGPVSASGTYPLLETNPVRKLFELFFIKDLPLLRSWYRQKNKLPFVVRFDKFTQSYYLSEY